MEEVDASELFVRRPNSKDLFASMNGEMFIFQVADGTFKISGGDQRLRTSTFTRDRPDRGKEQKILQEESEELFSQTTHQDDSTLDDAEAKNDFGL